MLASINGEMWMDDTVRRESDPFTISMTNSDNISVKIYRMSVQIYDIIRMFHVSLQHLPSVYALRITF